MSAAWIKANSHHRDDCAGDDVLFADVVQDKLAQKDVEIASLVTALNTQNDRVDELEVALKAIHADLMMRSDYSDPDGTKVVNCGGSVWGMVCDALHNPPQEQE